MSLARLVVIAALGVGIALSVSASGMQQAEVRAGDIVVHYWTGQDRLATTLLPPATGLAFPGLPRDILQRGVDVNVFLAPDAERFDSLTDGRAPEWGAGVAMPQLGVIVVPGYVSSRAGTHELPRIMRHELAHVALQRHLGDARVPRWFTEGYATWSAGQLDGDAGWQLRLALASSRAPSLDSLTLDWPLLAADARIAYLLSASAVQYLYSLGTPQMFAQFLAEWSASGDFESSLRNIYVVSSPQFERLWRTHVKRTYGWIQIIAQTAFIWVVLAVLVTALFVVRRRRDRRRLDALRATELPDTPAFWLDPPTEAVSDTSPDPTDDATDRDL